MRVAIVALFAMVAGAWGFGVGWALTQTIGGGILSGLLCLAIAVKAGSEGRAKARRAKR